MVRIMAKVVTLMMATRKEYLMGMVKVPTAVRPPMHSTVGCTFLQHRKTR
jgi:hypothetical protein